MIYKSSKLRTDKYSYFVLPQKNSRAHLYLPEARYSHWICVVSLFLTCLINIDQADFSFTFNFSTPSCSHKPPRTVSSSRWSCSRRSLTSRSLAWWFLWSGSWRMTSPCSGLWTLSKTLSPLPSEPPVRFHQFIWILLTRFNFNLW